MIGQHISGHHYVPAQYALQQIVEYLGNILFQLEAQYLTNIYQVVFCCCELENLDYLVLRYLITGGLPFKEFSEEWLFEDEV